MDNERTLLFGREQWCLASNVGQFPQAFTQSYFFICSIAIDAYTCVKYRVYR